MNPVAAFQPARPSEIDRLVAEYPLALVITAAADGSPQATPLPLVLQRDAQGEGVLVGHFSRKNPQLDLIRQQPRGLVAFSGAQGYIATSWFRDRRYAPTWNYEAVHFTVDIELDDRPEAAAAALETLIAHAEAPYPTPWCSQEMGPRFAQLAQYIVPFRARIVATEAQFKLGQGDPADVLADTYAGLARYGRHELAAAMRRHEQLQAQRAASA
ncbi:FMN-binding negative transcriptional regulator [Inhella proteolytica]|uniref:FMN-binding negative transcriptional regulator n=1 Tax=Inhella proteolytica TaxID=2795029 RepID=A0A931J380_9BURK|nr:FMN-binding negative transcriptional regulator [Inhella proteolytica]MBH9577481.1 FMN-binding negative transcriptional regulator [Inhella proteolytica]